MNYIREALDIPPLALIASAFALFTLGVLAGGPTRGGIVVAVAAFVRLLALRWLGGNQT